MKKLGVVVSLLLVFSVTFVSAGFFGDIYNKITGKVVDGDTGYFADGDYYEWLSISQKDYETACEALRDLNAAWISYYDEEKDVWAPSTVLLDTGDCYVDRTLNSSTIYIIDMKEEGKEYSVYAVNGSLLVYKGNGVWIDGDPYEWLSISQKNYNTACEVLEGLDANWISYYDAGEDFWVTATVRLDTGDCYFDRELDLNLIYLIDIKEDDKDYSVYAVNGSLLAGGEEIYLTSLNDGEDVVAGDRYYIAWNQSVGGDVSIYYKTKAGDMNIIGVVSSDIEDKYKWEIPSLLVGEKIKVYVESSAGFDESERWMEVVEKEEEELFCEDSDGGLNYYEKGLVKYNNEDGENFESYDVCNVDDMLVEGFCGPNSVTYKCPGECLDGACVVFEERCVGCDFEGSCVPYGTRIDDSKISSSPVYCSVDGEFHDQKMGNIIACQNSYECESNSCLDSICVEVGLWTKIFNWFRNLFS